MRLLSRLLLPLALLVPVEALADGAINPPTFNFGGNGIQVSSPSGASTIATTVTNNAQTGTTYTVVSSDGGKVVSLNNAAAVTVTLPQATTTGFGLGFGTEFACIGAGASCTITPTTSTIDGLASVALVKGQDLFVWSDGTNYHGAQALPVGSGSGSGTVQSGVINALPYYAAAGTTVTGSNLLITNPASAATFALTGGKTLTVQNTLTFAGTDGQTMTFPAASTTVAGLGTTQSFSGTNTFAAINLGATNYLAFQTNKFVIAATSSVTVTSGGGTSPVVTGGSTMGILITLGTGSPSSTLVLALPSNVGNEWDCRGVDITTNLIGDGAGQAHSITAATIVWYTHAGVVTAPTASDHVIIECFGL